MTKALSLERTVVVTAMLVSFLVASGALAVVACIDILTARRELVDAVSAASPRIERALRSGDATGAIEGMPFIASAKLYEANGRVVAQTPPAPRLRAGLSTRIASRLAATDIVCVAGARDTFCTEPSAAPLAIRIAWWGRVLAFGAIASLLVGAVGGLVLRRAILRRMQIVSAVIDRAMRERDYSQRIAQTDGVIGTLGTSINALVAQMQEHEAAQRRRTLELEAANRDLEGFAYAVSHDLRAPLGSVDGFAQALRDDYQDQFDETAKEYLSWILEGCRQMRELIEGLLEMARLARADMAHDDVDLSSIAHSVAESLRQKSPDRDVRFDIREGAHIVGDPRLMRAVLENLMANAFKFTRGRDAAQIEFGIATNSGEPAFYVRDNGAGFDPAQAARMFRPFQRLHSSREFEGTGIGLATVQKIVARHGGRAWAEGEVGKGATIYFTAGGTPA